MTETNTELKAVRALKRLEKSWPKSLWLFSANGSLLVMKKGTDGKRVMESTGDGTSFEQKACVARIAIENDGGDF